MRTEGSKKLTERDLFEIRLLGLFRGINRSVIAERYGLPVEYVNKFVRSKTCPQMSLPKSLRRAGISCESVLKWMGHVKPVDRTKRRV